MPLEIPFYTLFKKNCGVQRAYLPPSSKSYLIYTKLSETIPLLYVYFVSQNFNKSLSY